VAYVSGRARGDKRFLGLLRTGVHRTCVAECEGARQVQAEANWSLCAQPGVQGRSCSDGPSSKEAHSFGVVFEEHISS